MSMSVLIAEDDQEVTDLYRIALERKGYDVTLTYDGQECMRAYEEALDRLIQSSIKPSAYKPFTTVVLSHKTTMLDGVQTAGEILKLNSKQRIILASPFVIETLGEALRKLGQVVELIQKPFEPKILVRIIEDMSSARKLEEVNTWVSSIRSSRQDTLPIGELFDALKKIQKIGF